MRSGTNALEDAFCRAYTCAEAIEKFLARSLAPLNEPGTYALAGETKMTVAIDSERQVAWCNDSDVPRNAFNLVRHYRFGELDASTKDGTAMKRLPSYKAMLKLCREDVAVRKNLIHGIGTHEANDTDDWELKLTLNDNNQIEKTGQNWLRTTSDGGELTVNTARNEWAIKNPDSFGSASDLARKFDIADGDDFSKAMKMIEQLYQERENMPSQFPYSPIIRPVWDFTDTCHPQERQYSLQKDLGIDMSILPATVWASSPSKQSRPTYSPSKSKHNSGIKDAPSGSSRNAEHEIRDSHSSDDLDDEWKRRNGYKM